MKKYIVGVGLFLLMNSCLNNDFMEVYPKDQQTELTSFRSYENFKTYAWGLYNVFFGYAYKTGQTDEIFKGDYEADNMIKHVSGNESQWAYQKAKVPASSDSWDYEYIRRVNLMLDNIDQSSMNDAEKAHWRSVGYFFRAYKYFKMLSLYGDLPWVEHALSEDSEELYSPRDPRDVVAQNILNNLKYAEEHIKVDGDGNNTINRAVVQSLISRFCLFEGTWRKYHALQNATTYLEECTRASKEVMNKYTTLHPNYEELFNSESLDGINGIILYKEYATSQLCHGLTRMVRTGESQIEATKDAVDSYLCSDGHPIKNSSTYGGDKDVYAQFRNRDYRLYHTVCPPYMVSLASASTTQWKFTDNPSEREYIDLMATISKETYHRLPTSNFKGFITKGQPHFKNVNWGQGWNASQMGFWVWKYYNTHTDASTANGVCTTDAPLFRLGEILLNYAEAVFERDGAISDDDLNLSLNLVRCRVNTKMPKLTNSFVSEHGLDMRTEIRRERTIELYNEGFRLDDLKRWKTAETEMPQDILGVKWKGTEYETTWSKCPHPRNDDGILVLETGRKWAEKNYLFPLPKDQLQLNPNLKQNPGWE